MKIVLFTPTNPESAIGSVSVIIAKALKMHDVDLKVISSNDSSRNVHAEFPCEVINWTDTAGVESCCSKADLILYQIGNHYPYHKGCIQWMERIPGVPILHDFILGHLFWGWAVDVGREAADEVLKLHYGEHISQRFWNIDNSNEFMEFCAENATFIHWVTENATIVLTHSSWGVLNLSKPLEIPVAVQPMPYILPLPVNSELQRVNGSALTILTLGDVNLNKRHASVIKAIGQSQLLKNKIVYKIIGSIEHNMKESLEGLASEMGVSVQIMGRLEQEVLNREVNDADIIACLRYPALEAASASAIEGMLNGKPLVVTNTGFYAELPDNCVIKIDIDDEIPMLTSALERLAIDSTARIEISRNARLYAVKTFNSAAYAECIIALPKYIAVGDALIKTSKNISSHLASLGVDIDSKIFENIAAELTFLRALSNGA